jgi:hypothetical protein|tara:strand:+ start:677 stop:1123 length:447 start_codon:yes stop_codon:yes gene_type:complete
VSDSANIEFALQDNEEFISQFRDYKLQMIWAKKCTKCGSGTNLHMLNFGGFAMCCTDRFCGTQMLPYKKCTKCDATSSEYTLRCKNCEVKVLELADIHQQVHDAKKKMKRVSRSYSCGKITLKEKEKIHAECKEIKKRCKASLKTFIL